ncbi:MAG: helix-turn-helix domain-containing protein, partial [Parasporobacterium sp.]|nr:helix-turn-helix domain-containing protein [Parasporobacterium sp.]
MGLQGSELLVYALINNYSQRSQGCYYGSLDNTAKMTGFSRDTARRTLASLVDKGFLTASKSVVDGQLRTTYAVIPEGDSNLQRGWQNATEGVANCNGRG